MPVPFFGKDAKTQAIGAMIARRVGAHPLEPWSKRAWLQDGPAVVYDTIGSTQTYAQIGYLKLNRHIDPTIEDLRDREELGHFSVL